ncbi:MAG TPA: efflux RND transporter periplasmic adaptor subunit [Candidatus Binataceae bacterium]|nr:efflux RND transporter periplasmic adaptor subunit [Candidatus Binataceae bacterium]
MSTGIPAPRRALLVPIILAIAALAMGCRPGSRAGGEDESASEAAPNPVLIVTAAKAEIAPIESELRVLGTTVAMRHIIIRAPAAGRVLGLTVRNGDFVRKGDVVARVVNREAEAAAAGLAVARRIEPEDAAALARTVERYGKEPGIAVIAPESGVVAKPPVASGQMVGDLDALVDLVDPASIYVEAAVPIDEAHWIKPGMSAMVKSPLRPGEQVPARVGALIPAFDPGSATAPVRLDFTAGPPIREIDAPVEAQIVIARVPDAIVIPSAALFQDAGPSGFHVFLAGADGRAHRTPVTIGIRSGDRVQATSGVRAGGLVITSGGYALSDGLQVRVAGGPQ